MNEQLSKRLENMQRDPFFQCRTCAFFNAATNECRRDAPKSMSPVWPITTGNEWCGQWQSRESGADWIEA